MAMADSPSAASQILTDRLRSQRLESKRGRRRTDIGPLRSLDHSNVEDLFVAEARASGPRETASLSHRTSAGPASTTHTDESPNRRRQPGIRETDEKLQKLEKLNFDLKMEVFHRRQREKDLQEKLKEMAQQLHLAQKMQEEHALLVRMNKDLTLELDKSSEAVDQAVRMICDLEAKVEVLEQRELTSMRRSHSTANSDSGYAGSMNPVPNVIPPTPPRKMHSLVTDGSPRSPRIGGSGVAVNARQPNRSRIPSFMSNTGNENLALREAYTTSPKTLKQAKSFISIFSQATDDTTERLQDLPSPKLSVLSESSFPSIYNNKKVPETDEHDIDLVDDLQDRDTAWEHSILQDSIERVSTWIEHDRNSTQVNNPGLEAIGAEKHIHKTDIEQSDDSISDDRRPSNTSSDFDRSFTGWPDGGSIITGTPSRFRASRGATGGAVEESGLGQSRSDTETPRAPPTRPACPRASTSPQALRSSHRSGIARNDSLAEELGSPKARSRNSIQRSNPEVQLAPTKTSTRSSLAAKTQRFFRRSIGGATAREAAANPSAVSTFPVATPAAPEVSRPRGPLIKSATAADLAVPDKKLHAQRAARRRSIDPSAAVASRRRQSFQPDAYSSENSHSPAPEMSRTGAQAAWDSRDRRLGRGRSLKERSNGKVMV